jgi:hypothetical protein
VKASFVESMTVKAPLSQPHRLKTLSILKTDLDVVYKQDSDKIQNGISRRRSSSSHTVSGFWPSGPGILVEHGSLKSHRLLEIVGVFALGLRAPIVLLWKIETSRLGLFGFPILF